MQDAAQLIERARELALAVESGGPDFIGDPNPRCETCWYRNPDGPELLEIIEALTRVQPSTGLDMGAQEARGEPSEAMIEAGLSNLRDRRLLKWLFCEHPEDSAAIGYVDRPLDLDVQREVVAAIYKAMRAASSTNSNPRKEQRYGESQA